MRKDIYVIKNDVNDMCYVGQSVDYLDRFRKHKEEALRNNYKYKSRLYNAMNQIGVEHFYVELLESQIENYNEREIYWINKLNTLNPNGYNLAKGGMWYPNLSGVLHWNAKITQEEDLFAIYEELINSQKTLTDIGKEYGVAYNIIEKINQGECYKMDGYTYPLRKFCLTKDEVDRITFDLNYSNKTFEELAGLYRIPKQKILQLNRGQTWYRDYIDYPIRPTTYSLTEKIANDLISTQDSFQVIAERYGCTESTVIRINKGETHFNEKYTYPLRRSKYRLDQEKLNYVYSALSETDLSIEQIANKIGVSPATIKRINNGETNKYRSNEYIYPIRPL